MGSITSAPKAPASTASQIVYYTPAPSTNISSVDTSTAQTDTDTGLTPAQESERRAASLLRRERGRLGTVLTGFRGLLGLSNDNGGARKTLLGE
jgi:hypothetical protein